MTWIDATPPLLGSIVILLLPGIVVGLASGARPWLAIGAAPVLSAGVLGVGAMTTQMVSLPWSLSSAALVSVVAAVLCLATRLAVLRLRPTRVDDTVGTSLPVDRRSVAATIIGVLVGGGIVGFRLTQMFIAPENVSQTPDNLFHQNALRVIEETGRASSLTLGNLDPTATGISFYPGVWHDMTALIMSTFGLSTAVASNLMSIVIGAVFWPLSIVLLLRVFFGRNMLLMVAGGLLSAFFGIFPYVPLFFGVLYPNYLAMALLPALLALIAAALGVSRDLDSPLPARLLLGAIASVGTFLAHPSIGLLAMAASCPLLIFWSVRVTRTSRLRWRVAVPTVVGVSYVAIVCLLWARLRPSAAASGWKPFQTVAQAVGEAVSSAPVGRPFPTALTILTVLGIWFLLRRRDAPAISLVVICALTMWFYVVSASWRPDSVRDAITRVWYNDSFRTGPQIAAVVAPVAAYGLAVILMLLARSVCRATGRLRRPVRQLSATALVIVSAVAVTAWGQDYSVSYGQIIGQGNYRFNDHSPLLNTDEAQVVSRLNKTVAPNSVIANVPGDGSGLIYAMTGQRTVLMTAQATPTGDAKQIYDRLGNVQSDPSVCRAVDATRIRYVAAFGSEVNLMRHDYAGFRGLENNPGVTLVDSAGQARLYRITACDESAS